LDNAIATTDALLVSLSATSPMDGAIKSEITSVVAPLPGISLMIVTELSLSETDAARAQQINQWLSPVLARLSNLSPTAKSIVGATVRDWQTFLNSYTVPLAATANSRMGATKFRAKDLNNIQKHTVILNTHATNMVSMHYR
jgi:hypothetical protein